MDANVSTHNRKVEDLKEAYSRKMKNPILQRKSIEDSKAWMSEQRKNLHLNQRKMNASAREKAREKLHTDPDAFNVKNAYAGNFPIGSMYFFKYDAQTKKQLPYYDEYPLILPFKFSKGLMYALNMHYIPPRLRVHVLSLLERSKKGKYKVLPSSIVNALAEEDVFRPAIHSYYAKNIVSTVNRIDEAEWINTIMLPLARFVDKNGKQVSILKVYSDYNKRA